jgi:hypothetical protein
MTASPVVTPTPGTYPVPNQDATGAPVSTNAPATGTGGTATAVQATSAPMSLSSVRTGPQFTLPGHPYGATAGDGRPY